MEELRERVEGAEGEGWRGQGSGLEESKKALEESRERVGGVVGKRCRIRGIWLE